jgi:hypothetical protein
MNGLRYKWDGAHWFGVFPPSTNYAGLLHPSVRSLLAESNLPTGINIRGLKVELVAGGKSTRLIGLGLQVGTKDKQFMRMDIGGAHPKHGNPAGTGAKAKPNDELDVWDDFPFHFHVMQYDGDSNK